MFRPGLRALTLLAALPVAGAAQPYTISAWDGLVPENIQDYASGMIWNAGNLFEDGAMVQRGGHGQTFTVPVGSTLLSWSMPFSSGCLGEGYSPVPGQCLFRAYIARWDAANSRAAGLVWESGPIPDNHALGDPLPPWPLTPNVWLDAGTYVAFLLHDPAAPTPDYTGWVQRMYSVLWPHSDQPALSPGSEWVWLAASDPGIPPGELPWQVNPLRGDVQSFTATLDSTVIPEPASMALLATGLAGLAGVARRRRRESRD